MKNAIFCFLFLSVLCLVAGSPAKYTSRYDNFDVDEVLRSDRLLNNYVNCLLDKGPCTVEGTELKKNLADALKTECSKCTETQKEKSRKAIEHIRLNKPDSWKKLVDKYDPEHVYSKRLESMS